jgi:hypothetical protein
MGFDLHDFFSLFLFWWNYGLNSGLCVWQSGTLLLETHLQPILQMESCKLFAWAGLEP